MIFGDDPMAPSHEAVKKGVRNPGGSKNIYGIIAFDDRNLSEIGSMKSPISVMYNWVLFTEWDFGFFFVAQFQ